MSLFAAGHFCSVDRVLRLFQGNVDELSATADQREPRWVEAALKEYEAHRAEILNEAAAQQQILALGATAIGIVVAGGFNVWDNKLIATVAFLAAVPLLSVLVLVQWAGRAYAMMRVGVYLERLETAARNTLAAPDPVLTWEATLAKLRPDRPWHVQSGWNDFGAVGVFALLAGGSIALGAYRGWAGHEVLVGILTVTLGFVIAASVVAVTRGVADARAEARRNFPES
jgi:hypothetical protein